MPKPKPYTCPNCGHTIPARALASAMGARGTGSSKRRDTDYAALARKAHAARAANKTKSGA